MERTLSIPLEKLIHIVLKEHGIKPGDVKRTTLCLDSVSFNLNILGRGVIDIDHTSTADYNVTKESRPLGS